MDKLFLKCMPTIWEHEGGYNNIKEDRGGATNYGISLMFLKGLRDLEADGFMEGDINHDGVIDINDIKSLKKEDSEELYFNNFWHTIYNQLENELLSLHIFDMGVNAGPVTATKILQNVLGCSADGKLGPNTLKLILAQNDSELVIKYADARIKFYERCATLHTENVKFLKGWKNRVATTKFKL